MDSKIIKEHHTQANLCKTRPTYRQGKKLTAIKGYTINNESQHLFVYGVPQINLRSELKSLCLKFGKVLNLHIVIDHETEIFTECFHVQYERIQSARIAKQLLDNRSFYGGILHVCYAPEYESIDETRQKLFQRCKDVIKRLPNHKPDMEEMKYYKHNRNKQQKPNFILKDIDFYAGDPMVSNIKRIKYNKTIYKDDLQCNIESSSENCKPCIQKMKDTEYAQPIASTKYLIPIQVLKRKYNVNKSEKKIVFYNKVIKS